jgi:hypothetical protein
MAGLVEVDADEVDRVLVAAVAQRPSKVAVDSWLSRTIERWGSTEKTAATRRSPDRGYR